MASERPIPLSRRQFLARCGALGAAAMAAQLPGVSLTGAAGASPIGDAGAAMRLLARDTISGLVVFVVPGPDRYSQAQGLTDARPGGIEAGSTEPILDVLDFFLPMPDSFVQAMAAAFATGMSDVPMPALEPVLRAGEGVAATVDEAFQAFAANDETVPLSLLVALMLNFVATSVNPASAGGPIGAAPFANLSWAEKAEVFRRMEEETAELVALVDADTPEPTKGVFSGQIALVGGLLPAFPALYAYSEASVLDTERGVAMSRPVGWDLSGYAPGRTRPADGWDELVGYYEGRREADSDA